MLGLGKRGVGVEDRLAAHPRALEQLGVVGQPRDLELREAGLAGAEHRDGFRLAEIDLELRGEGEMLGTRQSGLAQFRVARLPEDVGLLEAAREVGQALLDADPELALPEHALLDDAVRAAYGDEALEPIPA